MQFLIANNICPESHADASRFAQLQRTQTCLANSLELAQHFVRVARILCVPCAGFVCNQCRHHERTIFRRQGRSLFINQVRMFNSSNAGMQRASNRVCRISVRKNIGTGTRCLVDRRFDFVNRELAPFQGIMRRRDAA